MKPAASARHDDVDYDVIIVGAGSAGGVLAARLSEDPSRKVLLLEAGPIYRTLQQFPPAVLDPTDMTNVLPGAANNWSLTGSVTENLQLPLTRGKGMGGSSAINGTYFVRGTPDDFAQWAREGNDEWSYEKVLPFFKRSERDLDISNELHGTNGPIAVRREPQDRAPEFTNAFTAACLELGFPAERDKNGEGRGGVGPVPMNIDESGRRASTALAYLLPNLQRPNLTVVGNAMALKLLFADKTTCVGVEAVVDDEARKFRGREVVVSAGTVRSPQLLMLSGIGPEQQLRAHGIEVRVALPGVGKNLIDHPSVGPSWTFKGRHRSPPGHGFMTSALNWSSEGARHSGDLEILPLVSAPATMLKLSGMVLDPLNGLRAIRSLGFKAAMAQARVSRMPAVVISLMKEQSRGSVSLVSSNPADPPAVNWNIFSEPDDRPRLRSAVRTAVEVFDAKPMREAGIELVGLDHRTLSDDKHLDEWIMTHLFSLAHLSGTCKMGPVTDETAVVDQYGRVHGVENLRVCDQSIFPMITSRGPNATAVMAAERMSAFFSKVTTTTFPDIANVSSESTA